MATQLRPRLLGRYTTSSKAPTSSPLLTVRARAAGVHESCCDTAAQRQWQRLKSLRHEMLLPWLTMVRGVCGAKFVVTLEPRSFYV